MGTRPGPSRSYPDNNLVTNYTVGPSDNIIGGWIDLGSPCIVTVTYNVKGLVDPEGLDTLIFGLLNYEGFDVPPVTPDQATLDGTTPLSVLIQTVVLSPSEYEVRRLTIAPRWCYISLTPFGGNTNTADVTVSVVT
jgi:hypothetical protein